MKKYILPLLISILFAPALSANEGTSYVGLQYAIVEVDFDGIGDVEPTALIGKFGHFVNDNVAIEGRLGIGLQDDELFGVDVDIENIFGLYAVFHSAGSTTRFYGVLGYSDAEAEFSGPGGSADGDESSISFGFGANIGKLNLEYMSYIDEDDTDATAISIGYVPEL